MASAVVSMTASWMPVARRRYSAGWRNRCAPAISNRHDCTPFESTDLRELDAPTRRGRHLFQRPTGLTYQDGLLSVLSAGVPNGSSGFTVDREGGRAPPSTPEVQSPRPRIVPP